MMMPEAPAFQLYASDFYMDTIGWSCEEVGAYFRLLMIQWVNGPIENDPKKLQKVCQMGAKRWQKVSQKVLSKFTLNGTGMLQNERLEETRIKQREYWETQSSAGKKGVEKKRELGIFPFKKSSDPLTNPSSENQALQSSSSLKNNPYIPFKEILKYLNQKSGKNFKWQLKETQAKIRARWEGGFNLADFKYVIDLKCDQWSDDKNMAKFLRPETLFGTKFEGYRNEAKPKPKSRLIS